MSATLEDTLIYVPGADSGSTQWRLATMQMVNWGNFHGHHSIDFHPVATLITGGSGSGKSTLLDAYTAVMMGSDVPFNGASNQAKGRARSDKQRNLVSYLRGQYSATDDGDGGARAQVLRGADRHTWGAVALTFTTTEGDEVFTALRTWFVPRGTTRDADVLKRILTVTDRVDLRELQPLAAGRFALKDLRELIPGVRNHDAYAGFVTTLETSLGLGSGGDGVAALKMLSRVQSSAALDNVDALFKQTVLDEPRTFSTAADVLGHFDELERSYAELERAYARQSHLAPLADLHGKLLTARTAVAAHDHARWGDPHGPAALWKSRVRVDCLDAAEEDASTRRIAAEQASSAATSKVADTNLARRASESAYNAAGGDRLASLMAVIDHLSGKVSDREQRVGRLRAAVSPLGLTLDSTAALSQAVVAAPGNGTAQDVAAEKARTHLVDVLDAQRSARARSDELRDQLAYYRANPTRVPMHLDRLRRELAAAAGLDPADVPFVAELIDLSDEHRSWRDAVEVVLAAEATQVVVDSATKDGFSVRIDAAHLNGRIRFVFADRRTRPAPDAHVDTVAGKLVYEDGPWRDWLQSRLTTSQAGRTVCVRDPRELREHTNAVTLAGQTRRGDGGAHGRSRDSKAIIGFSNQSDIDTVIAEAQLIQGQLTTLAAQAAKLTAAVTHATEHSRAWSQLAGLHMDDHDVWAARTALDEAEAELKVLNSSDDTLAILKDKADRASRDHEAAVAEQARAIDALEAAQEQYADIVERKDAALTTLERLEREGVDVEPDLLARLEAALAKLAAPNDPRAANQHTRLEEHMAHVQERQGEAVARAKAEEAEAEKSIEYLLRQFQERWPDPNLGTDLASYPDYLRVLAQITDSALAGQRDAWRDGVLQWTGKELAPLNNAMDSAITDIRGRGMFYGLELVGGRDAIVMAALERDLWVYPAGSGPVPEAVMVAPPFVITEAEIEQLVTTLRQAIDAVHPG